MTSKPKAHGWYLVKGHGYPCHACGEPCNALVGDPSQWPTMLPVEQSARPFHIGCAAQIMSDAERYRWLRRNAEDVEVNTFHWIGPGNIESFAKDLDAAINAEMAREKERPDV